MFITTSLSQAKPDGLEQRRGEFGFEILLKILWIKSEFFSTSGTVNM